MLRAIVAGAVVVLFAVVGTARGQLAANLTAQDIDEAIRIAADEKAAAKFLLSYVVQSRTGFGGGPLLGYFSTPFSRVVRAAIAARKQGKPFAVSDVTPDLVAP